MRLMGHLRRAATSTLTKKGLYFHWDRLHIGKRKAVGLNRKIFLVQHVTWFDLVAWVQVTAY